MKNSRAIYLLLVTCALVAGLYLLGLLFFDLILDDCRQLVLGMVALIFVFIALAGFRCACKQAGYNNRLALELERERGLEPLTRLGNRVKFLSELESELERSLRYRQYFAVVMLDIDGLKMINEFYGRVAGDLAILTVRDHVLKALRSVDSFFALGSGCFAIILPNTDFSGGFVLAERLRSELEQVVVEWGEDRELSLTVSCGLAVSELKTGETADLLLGRVELCLSRAKHSGRNRVC